MPRAMAASAGASSATVITNAVQSVAGETQAIRSGWVEWIALISEEFKPFYSHLDRIALAAENWARPETECPNAEAVDNARALLARLQLNNLVPTRLLPVADGGIGIYFRADNGRYADFECPNSGKISVLTSDGQGRIDVREVVGFEGQTSAALAIKEFLT